MPPASLALPIALAAGGVVALAIGAGFVRASGARLRVAQRLAAAKPAKVADVLRLTESSRHALRVTGRVRCGAPIVTANDERLVALHRTVEVELPGRGWRAIERVRESRRFQFWDHAGEITLDSARFAEPIVAIPAVWRGPPTELPDDYQGAVARLEAAHRTRVRRARAETRVVSITDRIVVVGAPVVVPGAAPALEPPAGGFIVSTLEFDAAMRLLAGRRRGLLIVGLALIALGGIACLLAAGALVLLLATAAL